MVPDAPYPAVANAIRRCVSRFMRETRIFTDEAMIHTQQSVSDYVLPTDECRVVYAIELVTRGPLNCQSGCGEVVPAIEDCGTHGQRFGQKWCQYGYWADNLGGKNVVINLSPVPKKDWTLLVKYSWGIGLGDCTLPDQIGTIYLDTIIAGALYYLLSMPSEEWYDKKTADDSELRFNYGVQIARNSKYKRVNGVLPMSGRRFLGVKI